MGVTVHLVDGTYELFRHHFGQPEEARSVPGTRGAVRGVLGTLMGLLGEGITHLGVATDHVIESFRNQMWPTYKSSAGIDPVLLEQFVALEEAIAALGIALWPMVELEADDALASAAAVAADSDDVERVVIHTPDKDLAQCVRGQRVVQFDRRNRKLVAEDDVVVKFGVPPTSIPDWLALVGDSADGFPGLPGFGAKTAAAVLAAFGHLEQIPADGTLWPRGVRGSVKLAATLAAERDRAFLFRNLATLRVEPTLLSSVEDLRWTGPPDPSAFALLAEQIGGRELAQRASALAAARS